MLVLLSSSHEQWNAVLNSVQKGLRIKPTLYQLFLPPFQSESPSLQLTENFWSAVFTRHFLSFLILRPWRFKVGRKKRHWESLTSYRQAALHVTGFPSKLAALLSWGSNEEPGLLIQRMPAPCWTLQSLPRRLLSSGGLQCQGPQGFQGYL